MSYCYVENTERIYKAYSVKIQRNYETSLKDPVAFANQLNNEYRKLRNSKSEKRKLLHKLPVRMYGSGDYIPAHYKFMEKLNFKFYVISKTLTSPLMDNQRLDLLKLENLTNLVLSLDNDNIENYNHIKQFFKQDRHSLAYTGMPSDYESLEKAGYQFDIFFNIGNKKIDKDFSKQFKVHCPCDSGLIAHDAACTKCNKCWRSSATKIKNWNLLV